MATVDKNFRIKNGLAVEGTTATVNGENILREGSGDSYIIDLIGGQATSANTPNAVVKRDGSGGFAAGQIALTGITVQNAGSIYEDGAFIIESNSGYDIAIAGNQDVNISSQNGNINLNPDGNVFINGTSASNQVATHGYVDGLASNYDAAGSASAAQTAAQSYADGLASNYDAAGSASAAQTAAQLYADGVASDAYTNAVADAASDATTKANAALQSAEGYADTVSAQALLDAENYTDTAITNLNLSGTYDALGAATTAENNAKAYTDSEVAALVDSAPALLDTLNELAAAIADNPNYASDVANLVATKADTTYVDSEISGANTTAQGYATTAENNAKGYADGLASNYDAAGAATSAENAAKSYADSLASNYDPAGAASTAESNANSYTDNSVNSLTDGTTQFTEVSIGWMSREVAAYSYANSDNQVTAYSWDKWKGASAKFLVRVRNGIHSQVSEILITKDNSDNIAITEYGIVTTNGILGDITAAMNGNNIELKVTAAHTGGTEIVISGTLMSYGD